MEKHAYLIMAHSNSEILKKLLLFIDDTRNDIYIHVDKKFIAFDTDIYNICEYSKVIPIERISVTWGGYSQIDLEYKLIKEALSSSEKYQYLHLLSGEDLPIKSQDEIHAFFDRNQGKEFVGYDEKWAQSPAIRKRYALYWFMQEITGKNRKKISWIIEHILARIEYMLKIDRVKKYSNINFAGGPNWFSITSELAKYVIEQEEIVRKLFKHTVSCDEIFLQTILANSEFEKNLYISDVKSEFGKVYDQCLRCIDFDCEESSPKYWEYSRLNELLKHNTMMFARKFKYETDQDKMLVDSIEKRIKCQL